MSNEGKTLLNHFCRFKGLMPFRVKIMPLSQNFAMHGSISLQRFSEITCLAWFVDWLVCLNEDRNLWNFNGYYFTVLNDEPSMNWSSKDIQLCSNAVPLVGSQISWYLE